jgi:hypothetical protein
MKAKDGRIDARKLAGFKYFSMLDDLFKRLRFVGTERDKAGNRQLFYDQYASLLLLYYFNPTLAGLRSIQEFSTLERVQKILGVRPTALGSLSEAAGVFDPKALEPIIAELAARAGTSPNAMPDAKEAALAGLIAVDGSLLRALPKMAWAVWQDATHRAVKMHVAFSVFAGVPVEVTVTEGNGSEREQWRRIVKPGGFYVADRGYADYSLLREFDELKCRFIVRLQENAVYEVERENPLTAEDRKAGVVRDVVIRRLGTDKHNSLLKNPLRIVVIHGSKPDQVWILATNDLGLSAELVAIAYHYRWQIELFFRWLKCVIGCRHLLSQKPAGVELQIYLAVIAALLIGLWAGKKPSKRTYEMICHYLSGWATLEELERHLQKLKLSTGPPSNN